MMLFKLFSLKNACSLDADECQQLNLALSSKTIEDIPEDYRELVKDYLIPALNINSVDHSIKGKLDELLIQLQNS
ncbi:CD1375 family protein [Shewanella sp. 0m-8]